MLSKGKNVLLWALPEMNGCVKCLSFSSAGFWANQFQPTEPRWETLSSCSLDYAVSSKSGILRESQLTTHQPLPRSSPAQDNVSREVQPPLLRANLTSLGRCRVCLIWEMRICSSELWSELPGQFLESYKSGRHIPFPGEEDSELGFLPDVFARALQAPSPPIPS